MDDSRIKFYAVGDIRVDRDDPDSLMKFVAPVLNSADITFGQLEASYSTRGQLGVTFAPGFQADPKNVPSIARAGIKVMSVASNHSVDCGHDAFLDTIKHLTHSGIKVIGGGKNIAEARTPAIFDIKGNKIAVSAYNAILQPGYEARENRPGMAPLRVKTFYEQVDWQPGTPAKVWTIADPDDVDALLYDVKKAKEKADLLFVNIHWGVHYMVGHLAMYQLDIGHKVIDAGADVLLGHHAHNLGPIEMYKGKPIFYSLGNFAFDYHSSPESANDPYIMAVKKLYQFSDSKYNDSLFPAVSCAEIIALFIIENKKIEKISFLPVLVNAEGQPEIVKPYSEAGKQVINLQTELCKNYNTELIVHNDEVELKAID